jgi:hypothetical protein
MNEVSAEMKETLKGVVKALEKDSPPPAHLEQRMNKIEVDVGAIKGDIAFIFELLRQREN